MSQLDVLRLKDNYDLYTKIQNDKRKKLLSFIYLQSRKYKELIEYSGLKPGSLYHHLNILDPLIEKFGHGNYRITQLGKQIIEELGYIEKTDEKPKISPQEKNDNGIDKPIVQELIDEELTDPMQDQQISISMQDPLSLIWIGKFNYLIATLIGIIAISLGINGVSLAGSAIYAPGEALAFQFIFVSFFLGVIFLYIVESIQQSYPQYRRIRYIFTIRLFSMLPGAIIGIGLLLLFSSEITPPDAIYPFLFALSLSLGVITSISGISYLRGQTTSNSVNVSIILGLIDLLLGFVVLISV